MTMNEHIIAKFNNWTLDLTVKIIFEYERFLSIKSSNPDLIPSDKIDKLWKFHILSTENYYNYCNQKFNKIIHYDNTQLLTSDEKLNKILTTIQIYKNFFGNIANPEVWSLNCEFNFNDLEKVVSVINNNKILSQQMILYPQPMITYSQQTISNSQPVVSLNNQEHIPIYILNKPPIEHIKIYVKYQNINKPGPYNLQLIDYKYLPTDNYENIKQIISNNTLYSVKNIKLVPHPDIYNKNFLNIYNGEINSKINVSSIIALCDFIIAEIYEFEIIQNNNIFGFQYKK